MKELTYSCVLLFISLVSATPYGYGTKGGAVAKADANAQAGAFDGISGLPFNTPSAPGYSGSFSKSSSSSFSSSSASSSSSSSSYSFSGSGSSALPGYGSSNAGNTICSTGACPLGLKQTSTSFPGSGAGLGTFGGANTGTFATSGAGTFGSSGNIGQPCLGSSCTGPITGCGGTDCNKLAGTNKCLSGNCDSGLQVETVIGASGSSYLAAPTTDFNKKCSSNECGSDKQDTSISSDSSGSNDIRVPGVFGSKLSYSTNDKNGPGNPVLPYSESADIQGPLSSYHSPTTSNKLNEPHKCTSSNCDNENSNSVGTNESPDSIVKKPVTYLTAPNADPPCTTPTCQDSSASKNKLLSSYDVPIHGTNDYSNPLSKKPCTGYSCSNTPSERPDSTLITDFANKPKSSNLPKCADGSCPDYFTKSIDTVSKTPNFSTGSTVGYNPTSSSYNVPLGTVGELGCKTPNCSPSNQAGAFPSGTYSHDSDISPSIAKIPISSPGLSAQELPAFGIGSSDCKTGKCAGHPSGLGVSDLLPQTPNYTPSLSPYPSPTRDFSSQGCNTPNCGQQHITSNLGNSPSKFSSPTQVSSGLPNYTPSMLPLYEQSVRPDCKTANCPDYPSLSVTGIKVPHSPVNPTLEPTTASKYPSFTQSGSLANGVPSAPTNCKTPNCADYPTPNESGFGSFKPVVEHSVPNYSNFIQPPKLPHIVPSPTSSIHTNTDEELPIYTGGFGGPPGILKPNDFSFKPPSSLSVPPKSGSYDIKPINSVTTAYPSTSSSSTAPQIVSGLLKPNTEGSSPDKNLPTYSGGFDGPSGFLKPNSEFSSSASTASLAGSSGTIKPIIKPETSATGLLKPSNGFTSANNNFNLQSGYIDHTKTHYGGNNLPAISGSAIESTGINKPNELGSLSSSNIHGAPPCSSGSCHSQVHSPVATGTLGSSVNGANAGAQANADAEAVAYTGGFGGPPGFLKPYDGGKIDISAPGGKQPYAHQNGISGVNGGQGSSYDNKAVGSNGAITNSGSDIGQGAGASAGAQASASALASATAGSGANSYGSNGNIVSGCDGGCGATGSGSYGSSNGFGLTNNGQDQSNIQANGQSSAAAKSVAGALSGAGNFGFGGGFSGSSASAHASSGYPTKGGYGR